MALVAGLLALAESPSPAAAATCDCAVEEARVADARQRVTTATGVRDRALSDLQAAEATERRAQTAFEAQNEKVNTLERERSDKERLLQQYRTLVKDATAAHKKVVGDLGGLVGWQKAIEGDGLVIRLIRPVTQALKSVINWTPIAARVTRIDALIANENWDLVSQNVAAVTAVAAIEAAGDVAFLRALYPYVRLNAFLAGAAFTPAAGAAILVLYAALVGYITQQIGSTMKALRDLGTAAKDAAAFVQKNDVKALERRVKEIDTQLSTEQPILERLAAELTTAENDVVAKTAVFNDAADELERLIQALDDEEEALAKCRSRIASDASCSTTTTTAATTTTSQPPDQDPYKQLDDDGDPHLLTLDGLRYDFQAEGEFVLLRSTVDAFEIQVSQDLWGADQVRRGAYVDKVASIDRVAVRTPAGQVIVASGGTTTLDGSAVGAGHTSLTGGASIDHGAITLGDGTTIQIDDGSFSGNPYLDVSVRLATARHGAVEGLGGDGDDLPENDVRARGSSTPVDPDTLGGDAGFEALYDVVGPSWVPAAANRLFAGPARAYRKPAAFLTMAELDRADLEAAAARCVDNGWTAATGLSACVHDVAATGAVEFADPSRRSAPRPSTIEAANAPSIGTTSVVVVEGDDVATGDISGPLDSVTVVAAVDAGQSLVIDVDRYQGSSPGGSTPTCPFAATATVTVTDPAGNVTTQAVCGPVVTPPAAGSGVWRAAVTSSITEPIRVGGAVRSAQAIPTGPVDRTVAAGDVVVVRAPSSPGSLIAWRPSPGTACPAAVALTAISPWQFSPTDGTATAPVAGRSTASVPAVLGGCAVPALIDGTTLAVSTMFRGTAEVHFTPTAAPATVVATLGTPTTITLGLSQWWSFADQLSLPSGSGHPTRVTLDLQAGTKLALAGGTDFVGVRLFSPTGELVDGGLFSPFGAPFGAIGESGRPATISTTGRWTLVVVGNAGPFTITATAT